MPVHCGPGQTSALIEKQGDNEESPIDLTPHVSGLWESSRALKTILHLTDKERNFQASSDPCKMLPSEPKYPNLVRFVFFYFLFSVPSASAPRKYAETHFHPATYAESGRQAGRWTVRWRNGLLMKRCRAWQATRLCTNTSKNVGLAVRNTLTNTQTLGRL